MTESLSTKRKNELEKKLTNNPELWKKKKGKISSLIPASGINGNNNLNIEINFGNKDIDIIDLPREQFEEYIKKGYLKYGVNLIGKNVDAYYQYISPKNLKTDFYIEEINIFF